MNKKKTAVILIFFLIAVTAFSGQETQKKLTLEQCILFALENNLNIAVEVLNPELADISSSVQKEIFLPSLSFNYNTRETNNPSFSWIEATGQVTSMFDDYGVQLEQLFPTGGTITASLYSYKSDTNQKFQTINPRYGSRLSFALTQPLLRDFGFKVNRREIIVASNNAQISEANFRESLIQTIYDVEAAYWEHVYSLENLKAMEQSLKLAQDLLAKNRREVEVGMMAPIEVLSAESEVAAREADIIEAENLVKNNEDTLKTIINLAEEEDIKAQDIVPVDKPIYEGRDINLDEALLIGMQNRPDLEASRIDIKSRDIELNYAKNQLLPGLNFEASYWSPGVSGTQILYKDNNPLTDVIVGTIPGDSAKALEDAFSFAYKNWSVGLTLSIPVETIFSRAQLAQAKVNFRQAKLRLQNDEQQAFLEIRNAVRNVKSNYKRIQAYKAARELAEKTLKAEEKKLEVGLSTNYTALQYQRDLADARSNEIRAIIDYNLALADLDRVLGITLENKGIQFSQISPL
ncbi:MAG: TolC family protein [Candidatus Aminicenantes bacterium]